MGKYRRIGHRSVFFLVLIIIFSVYLGVVVYFSLKVESIPILQVVSKNRVFLGLLIFLFAVMFFLVVYNLIQLILDRVRNREGSRFRLRLTVFFLIITSIPIIPITIISNNLISKSINLWFVSGIEESLMDAVSISKELYNRLSKESIQEWETFRKNNNTLNFESLKFEKIDSVVGYNKHENRLTTYYVINKDLASDLALVDLSDIELDSPRRIELHNSEYLFIPVEQINRLKLILVRRISSHITGYTSSISRGLQNYRTLKIIREPVKGIVVLIYTVAIMPFVLLSFYLGLVITRDVTAPIRELAVATQKVSQDQLDHRISVKARDEFKLLIDSFNRMTHELKVNRELVRHAERSAAWQDIARKIAHEIKNPLTPIKLSAERLLKLYKNKDSYREVLQKGIETIIVEVDNINKMVNEFSKFSRFPASQPENCDVILLIQNILDFLHPSYPEIQFSFYHAEKCVYLNIDKAQLRMAILNLLYNAINALSNKTSNAHIWVKVFRSSGKEGFYTISISDNGEGIDEDIKDKIFYPYFSKQGKGTGLGLTIVERIILDNRGRIWFDSEKGMTTFYVEFKAV